MGFRKAQYDVEEKGLDPSVPHKKLGKDGRILSEDDNPTQPVVTTASEKPEEKPVEKTTSSEEKTVTETPPLTDAKSSKDLDELQGELKELSEKKPPAKKVSSASPKKVATKRKPKKVATKRKPTKKTTKTRSKKKTKEKEKSPV